MTDERALTASMKVPPKRKGYICGVAHNHTRWWASMKVPPKRKGNADADYADLMYTAPQ